MKEWEATTGEELQCERKKRNPKGQYAVAIVCENVVIHLPQKISWLCVPFMKQKGKIGCQVVRSFIVNRLAYLPMLAQKLVVYVLACKQLVYFLNHFL